MCISRKFLILSQLTRLGHEYFQIFLSTRVRYKCRHPREQPFYAFFTGSNQKGPLFIFNWFRWQENFKITKFIFRCTGIPSPLITQSTTSRTSKQASSFLRISTNSSTCPIFVHFSPATTRLSACTHRGGCSKRGCNTPPGWATRPASWWYPRTTSTWG